MFDIAAPGGSMYGLIGGVVVFLLLCAVAFVLFRILGRSVKFVFRLVLVGILLLIAFAGLIAFWRYA